MKAILRVLLIAGAVLGVTLMSLWQVRHMSQAQGSGDIAITKTLNRANNVVRVGDVLEFTIVVTNQSAFTLTNVTLVDTFDETILAFQEATPVVTAASNTVTWGNVATMLNPAGMLPGETVVVTISFRAIRPRTAIVNRVEGRDIIRENSGTGLGSNNGITGSNVVPANAPVYKSISPPGSLPQAGLPVTFTQLITNDSGAFLIYLPLTDTYEAAFLQFNYALPMMPDVITPPGTLVWTNLASLAYFGPITPDTTLIITTVFTATTQVVNTTNRASTEGAIDEFGNEAAGGVAEVPITIIEDTPTPTVTPAPTKGTDNNDDDDDDEDVSTATPAPVIVTPAPVVTPTATPAAGPIYLPETGSRSLADPLGVIAALALLVMAGWAIKKVKV